MSETAAALLILPLLIGLVVFLEGTRICCTHLLNRRRARQSPVSDLPILGADPGRQVST